MNRSPFDLTYAAAVYERMACGLRLQVQRHMPQGLATVVAADDVLQEAWCDIQRHFGKMWFSSELHLQLWMRAVVHRTRLSIIRRESCLKRGGGVHFMQGSTCINALCAAVETPSRVVSGAEERAAVRDAMDDLPDAQRAATQLRLSDRDAADISTVMGRTVEAVYSQLKKSRRALRNRLQDRHDGP